MVDKRKPIRPEQIERQQVTLKIVFDVDYLYPDGIQLITIHPSKTEAEAVNVILGEAK